MRKAGASQREFAVVRHKLIAAFREHNIDFIVSPYEADSQLAYLATTSIDEDDPRSGKLIDLVISSDSDCIPLGIPKVLKNLDPKTNHGDLYLRSDIPAMPKEYSFVGFTEGSIACACILSGCDYLKNIPGTGIIGAYAVVKESFDPWVSAEDRTKATPPLEALLKNLCKKHMKAFSCDERELYWNKFLRSLVMFRHPVVYDPTAQEHIIADKYDPELLCYEPYNEMVEDDYIVQSICGEILPKAVARGIHFGWINPKKLTLVKGGSCGELIEGDTPADILEGYNAWIKDGGEELIERRKEGKRGSKEVEAAAKWWCKVPAEVLELSTKKVTTTTTKKKKKRKKDSGYTDLEQKYHDEFEKLYKKYAPKKLLKINNVMAKYKDNLAEALEAACEKYGEVAPTALLFEGASSASVSREVVERSVTSNSKELEPKLPVPEPKPEQVPEPESEPESEPLLPDAAQDEPQPPKAESPARSNGPKPGWSSRAPRRKLQVLSTKDDWLESDDEGDSNDNGKPDTGAAGPLQVMDEEEEGMVITDAVVDAVSDSDDSDDSDPARLLRPQNVGNKAKKNRERVPKRVSNSFGDLGDTSQSIEKNQDHFPKRVSNSFGDLGDTKKSETHQVEVRSATEYLAYSHQPNYAESTNTGRRRQSRKQWTEEETSLFIEGMEKYHHLVKGRMPGAPVFKAIKSDPAFAASLRDASLEQMKSYLRTMKKNCTGYFQI